MQQRPCVDRMRVHAFPTELSILCHTFTIVVFKPFKINPCVKFICYHYGLLRMNTHKSTIFIPFTASVIYLHAPVCAVIIRPSYETENCHFPEKMDAIKKNYTISIYDFLLPFNFAVSTQSSGGHYLSAKGTLILQ